MSESFPVIPTHSDESFPLSESFPHYSGNSLKSKTRNDSFPKLKATQGELFEARQRLITHKHRRGPRNPRSFRREVEAALACFTDHKRKADKAEGRQL